MTEEQFPVTPEEPAEVNTTQEPLPVLIEDSVIEVPVYPEDETVETTPKKKKRLFGKLLSVYAALLLVLISVGLWFFYAYLERYEAASPHAALDKYVEWIQTENYESIYAASDFEESLLNSKDEFMKYLARTFSGDTSTLSVREKVSSSEERKEYSLYMDGKRVSELTLLKNPEWGETAWSYVTEIVYQPDTYIISSDDVRITVNGVDFSLLNMVGEPVSETVLGGASDKAELPAVYRYTLKGLLNPPVVEALALSGDSCTVTLKETSYYITRPVSDLTRTENEALAQKVAFTYSEFVARDTDRAAMLALVYKESDLYATIRNFSNYWFTGHSSYKFTDVKITNYKQYTDSDFTCDVSFQSVYTVKKYTIKGNPFNSRLTFVRVGEDWKLLTLTPIAVETAEETTTTTTAGTTAATA